MEGEDTLWSVEFGMMNGEGAIGNPHQWPINRRCAR